MQFTFEELQRVVDFCLRTHQRIRGTIGVGKDGFVLKTSLNHAVKFLRHAEVYGREKRAYQRFALHRVRAVAGFNVPNFYASYDDLLAVEMEQVPRPFVVDFASAHLDEPPEFPPDVLADFHERIHDLFGPRAGDVFSLLNELGERYGVYMLDARPANIQF